MIATDELLWKAAKIISEERPKNLVGVLKVLNKELSVYEQRLLMGTTLADVLESVTIGDIVEIVKIAKASEK